MARRSLSSFSCLLDTRGDSDDLVSKSAPLLAVYRKEERRCKRGHDGLVVLTFWFPLDGDRTALHVSTCVVVSDLFWGFVASQGQFV